MMTAGLARSLGRAVALGYLAPELADALLVSLASRQFRQGVGQVDFEAMLRIDRHILCQAIDQQEAGFDRAIQVIKRAVYRLAERRMPGRTILAEVHDQNVSFESPLPEELVTSIACDALRAFVEQRRPRG